MTITSAPEKPGRKVNQPASCGVETGVHMGNTANNPNIAPAHTDWLGVVRLAVVVSMAAALAAVALSGVMTEIAIVVCVIVAATMASWFQIEHQRPGPRRVRVHRD